MSDKLLLLNNTKQQIKQALEAHGFIIGDIPFSQYPSVVNSMIVREEGGIFFFAFQGVPNTRVYGDLNDPYIGGGYATEGSDLTGE